MKSFYSIALFTLFAVVMSVMGVVISAMKRQDLSPAEAAVVALAIIAAMLTFRLAQAEKRIAHLENRVEDSKKDIVKKGEAKSKDSPAKRQPK